MWTYLLLFSGVAVVLIVFVRRVVLHLRKDAPEAPVEAPVEEIEREKKVRVSKDDKERAQELCNRGEAMIKAGKDEEAIKCFVQALGLNKDHQETKHNLAMLYFKKQMFSAAAALFQDLGEATKDPVHFSHLGLTLYKQNDFDGAKKAYQSAVKLDNSRPQRFVSLSQVYRSLGQVNNAIIALDKALGMEAENLDFKFLMADLHVEKGSLGSAKVHLEEILVADAKDEEAKKMLRKVNKTMKELQGGESSL